MLGGLLRVVVGGHAFLLELRQLQLHGLGLGLLAHGVRQWIGPANRLERVHQIRLVQVVVVVLLVDDRYIVVLERLMSQYEALTSCKRFSRIGSAVLDDLLYVFRVRRELIKMQAPLKERYGMLLFALFDVGFDHAILHESRNAGYSLADLEHALVVLVYSFLGEREVQALPVEVDHLTLGALRGQLVADPLLNVADLCNEFAHGRYDAPDHVLARRPLHEVQENALGSLSVAASMHGCPAYQGQRLAKVIPLLGNYSAFGTVTTEAHRGNASD